MHIAAIYIAGGSVEDAANGIPEDLRFCDKVHTNQQRPLLLIAKRKVSNTWLL